MFQHSRQRKRVMALIKKRQPKGGVMYGHVQVPKDIKQINAAIRSAINRASTEDELEKLRSQSQYLYTLTHSPAWSNIPNIVQVRDMAASEYSQTARAVNNKLVTLGSKKKVDEVIGKGKIATEV